MLNNQVALKPISAGGSGGDTYPIPGSGLFVFDGNSDRLLRPQLAGNQKTFTFHCIFKYGGSRAATPTLINANGASIWNEPTGEIFWDFNIGGTGYRGNTIALLRDEAAWYAFEMAVDTTQVLPANRLKVYLNGIEQDQIWPAVDDNALPLNGETKWNSTGDLEIGAAGGGQNWPHYVARIALIDGLQLEPTDFGEFTEDGFWQINDVSDPAWDYPINTTTSVATMTGNSAPSGYVASDNGGTTGEQPFEAFDGVLAQANRWQGGAPASNPYLQIQTPTALNVVRYTMMGRFSGSTEGSPTDFTLKASNSGAYNGEEIVLDTQSSLSWSVGETKSFDVTNTSSYTYHRVVITDTQGNASQRATIVELKLIEPSDSKFGNNGCLLEGGVNVSNGTDSQDGGTATEAETSLLLHFDGSDAATTSTDSSSYSHTLTFVGNAQLDTAQKKFGTSSLLLDGNGDYVTIPDHQSLELGTGDFTISFQVYFNTIHTTDAIFTNMMMGKYTGDSVGWLLTYANGTHLTFYTGASGAVLSTSFSLSTGQWYHMEISRSGTAVKWFVDGVERSSATSSVNLNGPSKLLWIGVESTTYQATDRDLDGFIDEVEIIKGSAAHTSGFTAPSVAHTDPATANHFTPTGTITTTADSPTNDADNGYGNYATFNPLEPDGNVGTFSNGNRKVVDSTTGDIQHPLNIATPSTGKWYCEFSYDASLDNSGVGIGVLESNSNHANTKNAGIGWIFLSGGGIRTEPASSDASYGSSWSESNTIGVAIDMDNGNLFFSIDGVWQNSGNPDSGSSTGAAATGLSGNYVIVSQNGTSDTAGVIVNSGQSTFTYPIGAENNTGGFSELATQNFPEPAVPDYRDEYYIEADIIHPDPNGNGTTEVTLPKSVDGGAMVRIKRTDVAGNWFVFDTLRGNNKFSLWNTTGVEDATAWTDQNLTGTTLTLPSALTSGNYLIEVFYVGEYFQINGFVGSHPTVQTLSYETDLDSAPGFMAFFNRDGSTQERTIAYHISTGNASRLDISDNVIPADNAGAFGSFTPTTMEFKVGNEENTNQNGANIISYHWANSGPYAFGSYIGNMSSDGRDGPVININGSPNSWFTKRIDSSDSWQLVAVPIPDNDFNPVTQRLQLEQAALISTNSNMTWDRLANGWKVRGDDSGFNSSGGTYIYGAFGIEPIKYGRAK